MDLVAVLVALEARGADLLGEQDAARDVLGVGLRVHEAQRGHLHGRRHEHGTPVEHEPAGHVLTVGDGVHPAQPRLGVEPALHVHEVRVGPAPRLVVGREPAGRVGEQDHLGDALDLGQRHAVRGGQVAEACRGHAMPLEGVLRVEDAHADAGEAARELGDLAHDRAPAVRVVRPHGAVVPEQAHDLDRHRLRQP